MRTLLLYGDFKMLKPEVITLKELYTSLRISRSMALLKMKKESKYYDSLFPQPLKLGARRIGFLRTDMHSWLDSLKQVA